MGRERVAVAAGIVIALVAAAGLPSVSSDVVQFQATDSPSNPGGWNAVLNYEIDANWTNVTDYWVDGDFSDVIVCNVDWVLLSEETTSTDRDNLRQYALDYEEGEFGFLEVKNGTQTKKIHVCSSFDLQGTSGSAGDWESWEVCKDFGPDGEDSQTTGPHEFLGFQSTGYEYPVTDEEAGDCLTLSTAATDSSFTPYTGIARAKLKPSSDIAVHDIEKAVVGGVVIDQTKKVNRDDGACGDPCYVWGGQDQLFTDTPGVGTLKVDVET